MKNIFANLGPGISKAAGDQSNISKVLIGDKNHYSRMREKADQKLDKAGAKKGFASTAETMASTAKRNVSDYLSAQDLNYKDTVHLRNKAKLARGAMTATAVGAAVLAPRYLTGGNLTRNGNGEKDIAGIPFV